MYIIWIWIWIFVVIRVVPRRLSFLPQAKMHPCLLLELTRRNTSQSLTLFPMLAALPIALLPSPRFFISYPFWYVYLFLYVYFNLLVCLFLFLNNLNFPQVINDRFGIVEGLMTTVHAITGSLFSCIWYYF